MSAPFQLRPLTKRRAQGIGAPRSARSTIASGTIINVDALIDDCDKCGQANRPSFLEFVAHDYVRGHYACRNRKERCSHTWRVSWSAHLCVETV